MIRYRDLTTFYNVTSDGYGRNLLTAEAASVYTTFVQNTGYNRSNFQDLNTADAICYPDPTTSFIVDNFYRLEGWYVLAPMYNVADNNGWYRVLRVSVNRDHLLTNTIDNVELLLKKVSKPHGIS